MTIEEAKIHAYDRIAHIAGTTDSNYQNGRS